MVDPVGLSRGRVARRVSVARISSVIAAVRLLLTMAAPARYAETPPSTIRLTSTATIAPLSPEVLGCAYGKVANLAFVKGDIAAFTTVFIVLGTLTAALYKPLAPPTIVSLTT